MKSLVIANTAGGTAKSTTAHALAVAAVEYGKKVLLMDADPAATLTFYCGIENPRITSQEFLTNTFSLDAAVVKTSERFSFLPSSTRLSNLDINQVLTKESLKLGLEGFDLVIVDTATGPNQLAAYFMESADLIVIPTTNEIASIRGAVHVKDFARTAQYSGALELLFVRSQEEISKELVEQLESDFRILEPAIREDSFVPEAQLTGRSVVTASKTSGVAADYREICYSILEELTLI